MHLNSGIVFATLRIESTGGSDPMIMSGLTRGEAHAARFLRAIAQRVPLVDEEKLHQLVHRTAARLRTIARDRDLLMRLIGWAAANWVLDAASLYRLGYAPRVVVARGRDAISVARQVSGEPSRQERAVRVLVHVGVPEAAVVTLSQEVDNTVQELAADFAFATKQGLRRVILVTSANHTRRVRVIWNSRYERRISALVYPTSWEAYDARRWWASRRTMEETIHEALGIVHFMLGSPLPTFDPKS